MNKRLLIYGVLGLIGVTVGIVLLSYFTSTTAYTITFTHVSRAEVVQNQSDSTSSSPRVVASVQKSGDTVRLTNGQQYVVQYVATDGFASGAVTIDKDTNISIDPDFSESKYATLITQELPAVRAAITQRYPNVTGLFTIDHGAMRGKGIWFVAQLTYSGEYSLNSDNLRVLLKSEGGQWKLVTQPDIILTTFNYPRLPLSVLSWANNAF
ncbi:MAG: hypothetical protein ABIP74_00005 [Candidatus Saccharimonas sp.]